MHDKLRTFITNVGYDPDKFEEANVSVDTYKKFIKNVGYDPDKFEAAGLLDGIGQPKIDISVPSGGPTVDVNKTVPTESNGTPQLQTAPSVTDGTATSTNGEVQTNDGYNDNIGIGTEELKQVGLGAARSTALPLGKIVEDGLNKIGIDTGNWTTQQLTEVNEAIKDYENKHPDQTISPADFGSVLAQVALPAIRGGMAVSAAVEGSLVALDGIGRNNDYSTVGTDFAKGAAIGATVNKLTSHLELYIGPLSREAKYLVRMHPDLSEEAAVKALKGVPKEDQAYALANIVDKDFAAYVQKGVVSNKDKLLLKKQVKGRTKAVNHALGDVDTQVKEAQDLYGQVSAALAKDNMNTFDISPMVPNLTKLSGKYAKTKDTVAEGMVNRMLSDIEEGKGTMTLQSALEFRKDLNDLLTKTRNHREITQLEEVKKGVEKFLSNNLTPDMQKALDAANATYARAKNNQQAADLIAKHTSRDATDWVALDKDLKASKLNSPEIDNATKIIKEFSHKFKNDPMFKSTIVTKGANEKSPSSLYLINLVSGSIIDTFRMYGTRLNDLKVQKAIRKSIRNAKDPEDLYINMIEGKVPPGVARDFANIFSGKISKGARAAAQARMNESAPGDIKMINSKALTETSSDVAPYTGKGTDVTPHTTVLNARPVQGQQPISGVIGQGDPQLGMTQRLGNTPKLPAPGGASPDGSALPTPVPPQVNPFRLGR